jgi:isopenicillin-N N-acyltransferase-like protein
MSDPRWIRRVKISGSPFERGHQLGTLCRKEIENTLEAYRTVFERCAGLDTIAARRTAAPFSDAIATYDGEIMEEIAGMAKALDRPLEDLVAINARTELLAAAVPSECTSIAVLPEASSDGRTWVGQNWDWSDLLKPSLVLLEIEQPGRPRVLMVAEAGIVGKMGMNSAGIGACLNILSTVGPKPGVPVHVMLRGVLNAATLGDALAALFRMGSGGCSHFLVGSREGLAMGVEVAFHWVDHLYPEDGLYSHANHFASPRFTGPDLSRKKYPDTLIRARQAFNLLQGKKRRIGREEIEAALADHVNHPRSICRHKGPGTDPLEEIFSLVSVVMDLTTLTMHLKEGPPCRHTSETVTFSASGKA